MLRLVDRLSCTVGLRIAGIPMPDTRVTEDPGCAVAAVEAFGSAVFKPLFSTKARGMTLVEVSDADFAKARNVLVNEVLPDWADRAGADWASRWNESVGQVVGVTIATN